MFEYLSESLGWRRRAIKKSWRKKPRNMEFGSSTIPRVRSGEERL